MMKLPLMLLPYVMGMIPMLAAPLAQERELNPGNVTAEELVQLDAGYKAIEKLIDEMQAAGRGYDYHAALDKLEGFVRDYRGAFTSAYLYDDVPEEPGEPGEPEGDVLNYELAPVFAPGGQYAHLGEIPEGARRGAIYGGPFKDWGGHCWAGTGLCVVPESLSFRTVIFNDDAASWGEHGPMRATREVNVSGTVKGLTYWRPGDWTKGRDGHGFYWNVLGDVTLEDCHVFEAGGQGYQFVSRPEETGLPWEQVLATNRAATLTVRDCSATDCGQIEYGQMVHSSYPFSFFAPGQALDVDGLTIRCEFPAFTDKDGVQFQSRGGVFIGPGQTHDARTSVVWLRRLDIEVTKADRSELVLWAVDEAHVVNPRIIDHGGTADVRIVVTGDQACGMVEIIETQTPLQVQLMDGHPHKPPMETVQVPAGGSFIWPR